MSNNNNGPVRVTGQERGHPAIRLLARACIELARQQLEREQQAGTEEVADKPPQPTVGDSKESGR